ncbi:DNA helicase MCM8 [Liparis tanakae]|uniref:DNA helicase MCM8 n=1 Tax=Liparis tanakae TaxID=230148 RepID=A0A4Z2HBS9_9TELE|nr:DNA helicase MCM8 [Liparis tanakae]
MSQRGAAKRLVNALHAYAQRTNQTQFDLQTLRSVAAQMNIKLKREKKISKMRSPSVDVFQVMDFEGLVSSLNEQGFLLKKGAKLYQLQTV